MGDPQQEHNHYYTDGLMRVTAHARQFGFDMPVHVTNTVWRKLCLGFRAKNGRSTDQRIFDVLKSCFGGLSKKMSVQDDFVSFTFKHYYTDPKRLQAKKPAKTKCGARLMLNPDDNSPWLLIYVDGVDTTFQLRKGVAPDVDNTSDPVGDSSRNDGDDSSAS